MRSHMSSSTMLIFGALALLLAWAVWRAQQGMYLTQYLFFLRYPLIAALALVAGPFAVTDNAVLGNLLVLDGVGVALVSALAGYVASAIVYVFSLIFGLTPARVRLTVFRRADDARQEQLYHWLERWHWGVVLALIAPLSAVLVLRTYSPRWQAALGVVAGITFGWLMHWLATVRLPSMPEGIVGLFARWVQGAVRPAMALQPMTRLRGTLEDGFIDEGGRILSVHARAVVFLNLTLLVYAAGYFVLPLRIGDLELTTYTPALMYVLLLLMVLTLVLGAVSFYFDKFRVPSTMPLVLISLVSYSVFARDHYFQLIARAEAPPGTSISASTQPCSLPPEAAVRAWRGRRGEERPSLVLVAASGGGITASLWTARVLTGLSDPRSGLGDEFARSVALISSVSGGGVGAAYFVDAFTPDANPVLAPDALGDIVTAAGRSSLNQTAYAIAYNDLLAIFLPFLLSDTSPDRGWALESVWRKHMREPQANLSSWRAGVAAGWRPTQIFNATIAETGERLLLTPIDCPTLACGKGDARWRARSFADLQAKGDLDVVTAARLSATFPWVTPLARQPGPAGGYHIADGGYYDNFGVITALEWLSRVHAELNLATLVDKVILVQIRAASRCVPRPRQNSGWLYATVGPLVTMLNVRNTSQRNSNEAAIAALKAVLDQAAQPVAFETVSFELDEDSPLSWHLSGAEQQKILERWDGGTIRRSRDKLSCLWRTPAERWVQTCATAAPADLSRRDAAARVFETARHAAEHPAIEAQDPRECED